MALPERIVFDGFRYLIYCKTDGTVMLEITDDARNIQAEIYFPPEAWAKFMADCDAKPGELNASPDLLRRLGI